MILKSKKDVRDFIKKSFLNHSDSIFTIKCEIVPIIFSNKLISLNINLVELKNMIDEEANISIVERRIKKINQFVNGR